MVRNGIKRTGKAEDRSRKISSDVCELKFLVLQQRNGVSIVGERKQKCATYGKETPHNLAHDAT
jgi:hypothetical protein